MTRVGEFVTLAPSLAASSGSHTGVAVLCPSGPLDLSEESMTRVGSAVSTIPSERYPSGSLDLSEESMTHGRSIDSGSCLPRNVDDVPRGIATCYLSLG